MKVLFVASKNTFSGITNGSTLRLENICKFLNSNFTCDFSYSRFPLTVNSKSQYDLIVFLSFANFYKSIFLKKGSSVIWFDNCDSKKLVNDYFLKRRKNLKTVLRIIRDCMGGKFSKRSHISTYITHLDRVVEEPQLTKNLSYIFPNYFESVISANNNEREVRAKRLFFIGDGAYLPNVESLTWLINQVLPKLKNSTPELLPLQVIGRGYENIDSDLIYKHGYTSSISHLIQPGDINLCASPLAAGLKNKILLGISFGMWTVCNTAAFNGIKVTPYTLIADSSHEFVEGILRCNLSTDEVPSPRTPILLSDERTLILEKLRELI